MGPWPPIGQRTDGFQALDPQYIFSPLGRILGSIALFERCGALWVREEIYRLLKYFGQYPTGQISVKLGFRTQGSTQNK